jgi:hypothetical protein
MPRSNVSNSVEAVLKQEEKRGASDEKLSTSIRHVETVRYLHGLFTAASGRATAKSSVVDISTSLYYYYSY